MYKRFFASFYLFFHLFTNNVYADHTAIPEPPFEKGEYLEYQVSYSFIQAGTIVMSVDKELHEVNKNPCYKLQVKGTSNQTLNLLGMSVNNTWESYLDVKSLQPRRFLAHIQEKNYERKECVDFDYQAKKATIEVTESIHGMEPKIFYAVISDTIKDMVSGYYGLRDIDTTQLKPNDKLVLSVLHENQIYNDVNIVYLGKTITTTKLGKVATLVFAPMIPYIENGIFKGERPVEVFISEDVNKIPVKLRANLMIGAVDIELSSYKGLRVDIPLKK